MKRKRETFSSGIICFYFVLACLVFLMAGISAVQAENYSVALNILNTANSTGEIGIVEGTDVEVEFDVTDPVGELLKNDLIRLVRADTGCKVYEKQRGSLLNGSVSLRTKSNNDEDDHHTGGAGSTCSNIGPLRVQYVHNNTVIASAPAAAVQMVVYADSSEMLLLKRIIALEQAAPVPGPEGPMGPAGPQGPTGSQGPVLQGRKV